MLLLYILHHQNAKSVYREIFWEPNMWGNSIKDHKQFYSFNCICDMTYNSAGAKSASIFSFCATLHNTSLLFVSYFKILKHKKQANTAFYIHLCSYWVCVYHVNMFFFVQYYLNKVTAKKLNNALLKSTQNTWLFSIQ